MALFRTVLGLYGGVLCVVERRAVSYRDSLYVIYEMVPAVNAPFHIS